MDCNGGMTGETVAYAISCSSDADADLCLLSSTGGYWFLLGICVLVEAFMSAAVADEVRRSDMRQLPK